MKIGNVDVKVSIVAIAVFVFFTIFLLLASLYSPVVRSQLIWLIPILFLLLVIPIALNYMSRSQYTGLEPIYEAAEVVAVNIVVVEAVCTNAAVPPIIGMNTVANTENKIRVAEFSS